MSLGITVICEGHRFYDAGEDFWPSCHAIWGRLVAQQPGPVGHCTIDAKAVGSFMPPVFKGEQADTLGQVTHQIVSAWHCV